MIESGFTYLYWPFLLLFLIFIKTPEELNSQVFSGSVKSISRNKKNTWNLDYQVFKRVSIMIASFSSAFYRRNRSKSASPLHCRGPKNTLSIWSRWVLWFSTKPKVCQMANKRMDKKALKKWVLAAFSRGVPPPCLDQTFNADLPVFAFVSDCYMPMIPLPWLFKRVIDSVPDLRISETVP